VIVPTLLSGRLRLEPISIHHSAGMFRLWSNAAVCEFSGPISDSEGNPIESPVRRTADSDKIIEFWERASDGGWGFRWAITHRQSEVFVGTAGFNSLGTCSEYAYHLHPDHWQRGYMSEATAAALDWLRNSDRSDEIEVFIAPLNVRSIAFAERHGFHSTGEESDGAVRYLKRSSKSPTRPAAWAGAAGAEQARAPVVGGSW
jgi:ribosomal-protein-alanine N-acetyltransferase